jgi:type I restriction enzyme R subunit
LVVGVGADDEVDDFCKLFYDDKETDEQLQPILNRVVNKWKEIDNQEQKEEFKSHIQSYVRLYGYISQIISFEDIELEKLFIFLKYVNKKLPKEESERLKISDSIDLDSLRIQKIGEHQLSLEDKQGEIEPFSPDGSTGMDEEPMDFLSEILKKINFLTSVSKKIFVLFRHFPILVGYLVASWVANVTIHVSSIY